MTDFELAIRNTFCGAAETAQNAAINIETLMFRPHVRLRPKLYIDGNQWCALYGDDLQNGVAGFGDCPMDALYDFDTNCQTKLSRSGA